MALSLPLSGSTVGEVTVTVLTSSPRWDGCTMTSRVIVGAAPTGKPARVQVTTPPASEHVQPVPAALMKLTPAGRVSETVRVPWSSEGPALLTPTV